LRLLARASASQSANNGSNPFRSTSENPGISRGFLLFVVVFADWGGIPLYPRLSPFIPNKAEQKPERGTMGKHRGWRIRKVRGSWLGLVREHGKDRSRSFTGEGAKTQATTWARDEASKLQLGITARVELASRTEVMVADYLEELRTLNRSASHLKDVTHILGRLSGAVPDLAARGAAKAVADFLKSLVVVPRGSPESVKGDPVAPRTRNKYLVVIRGLCQWAIANSRLREDPTKALREAKEPDYLRPQFTVDELRAMARAIDHPYHLRFVVGFYLGLRLDEVAQLQWSGLDVSGRVWTVTGKGNKQRLAHVPDEALTLLTLHQPWKGHVCADKVRRQHAVQHGRDLKTFMATQGIKPDGRSPHSLRHSHAGVMTATGQPSLLLAAHLGHASAQTTAEYTKLATRYVAAVRGWPRGQVELLTGWSEPIKRTIS
jgi:integrase